MTPESATVTINRGTEAMTDGLASIRSRFPFIIGCFPDPVLDSVLIDFPITKARMAEDMALLRQADVTVEPIEIVISHLMEDGRNPDYPSVVESHRTLY